MPSEQTPLTLTTANVVFQFQDFEVPEELTLGGSQQEATHQFPGGRRSVQVFGAVPPERIPFSGIIQGPGSFQRAKALDAIRISGQPCTLSYGLWKYVGILKKFDPKIKHEGWVPYTAEFLPTQDQSQAGITTAPTTPNQSLANVTSALSAMVTGYQGSNILITSNAASIGLSITLVQSAINAAGGSIEDVTASALATQLVVLRASAIALAPLEPVPNVNATLDVVDGMITTENAMADLVWQQETVYLLQQLILLLTFPPIQPRIIAVNNPCLIILASQFYGDAGQWATIAAANNNFPIFAKGLYSLVIPAASS